MSGWLSPGVAILVPGADRSLCRPGGASRPGRRGPRAGGRDRFIEDGVEVVDLEVVASNAAARAVYARWGFREETLTLAAPVAALAERLGEPASQPSFGSIHVQTDDVDRIATAVEMYVPRLPGRSTGSIVSAAAQRLRHRLRRCLRPRPGDAPAAREGISSRTGLVVIAMGVEEEAVVRMIMFDRGGIVDEYASVPSITARCRPAR